MIARSHGISCVQSSLLLVVDPIAFQRPSLSLGPSEQTSEPTGFPAFGSGSRPSRTPRSSQGRGLALAQHSGIFFGRQQAVYNCVCTVLAEIIKYVMID